MTEYGSLDANMHCPMLVMYIRECFNLDVWFSVNRHTIMWSSVDFMCNEEQLKPVSR